MASLARFGISLQSVALKRISLNQQTRYLAYWNKDWRPGPYPKTAAERSAAAKKYGLRIEDYEPYPDDGTGFGDYPKLPVLPDDNKDNNTDYDHPYQKRFFGEPMHKDHDLYTEDKCNPQKKYLVPLSTMKYVFFSFMASMIGIYMIGNEYPIIVPAIKKQYPNDGSHYTFESN